MAEPRQSLMRTADVPPADVDGVRAIGVGTLLWVVALLALLPFRARLESDGNHWLLLTCAVGVVLGLLGELYCLLRRASVNRRRRSRECP